MPVLVKKHQSCLFVHVPKTGGSSLEAAARRLGWTELLSIRRLHADQVRCFRSTPQHFHAAILESFLDCSRFDKVFLICRHPFERFKSEYYWQLTQRMTRDSPATWTSRVIAELDKDRWAFDNHLRPQHEFVLTSRRPAIFRLEEGGIDKALAHMDGEHEGRPSGVDLVPRIYRKVVGHGKKKRSFRTETIESEFETVRSKVEKIYEDDYKFFGYEC